MHGMNLIFFLQFNNSVLGFLLHFLQICDKNQANVLKMVKWTKRVRFLAGTLRKKWCIGPNWPLLGLIRRILSRLTASGYIFRLTLRLLSDVSYSDECPTEKAFQYVERMLPLFRVVVKYCSTNRLFNKLNQVLVLCNFQINISLNWFPRLSCLPKHPRANMNRARAMLLYANSRSFQGLAKD